MQQSLLIAETSSGDTVAACDSPFVMCEAHSTRGRLNGNMDSSILDTLD